VVPGFMDVAVVSEAIQQRGGHLRITGHLGPFAEAEVGGDNDTGVLVDFAEQMKQQRAAGGLNGRYPS
jgi:hypothetical protein